VDGYCLYRLEPFATLIEPCTRRVPNFARPAMNRSTPSTLSGNAVPLRLATVVAALSLFAFAAAPALAQDPTSAQYETSVVRAGNGDGGGTSTATHSSSGLQAGVVGLPFTGLDLIALAAVALAFTSVGFALRRMTVSKRADSA
jgi:hypothetical protein